MLSEPFGKPSRVCVCIPAVEPQTVVLRAVAGGSHSRQLPRHSDTHQHTRGNSLSREKGNAWRRDTL